MTVADLIEALKQYDADESVYVEYDGQMLNFTVLTMAEWLQKYELAKKGYGGYSPTSVVLE